MSDIHIPLTSQSRVKVLGDSLAAGRGASDCAYEGPFILNYNARQYYEQSGGRCWASRVKAHIADAYGATLINFGTHSSTSYHLHKFMHYLIEPDDSVILLMIGANNRKIPGGMALLENDLVRVVHYVQEWEKDIVLLTCVPSTAANEFRGDRRYHMDDVAAAVRRAAARTGVPCIDVFAYLNQYAAGHDLSIEELMTPEEEIKSYGLPANTRDFKPTDWIRLPDGLHPPDSVHKLIADYIIKELGWENYETTADE